MALLKLQCSGEGDQWALICQPAIMMMSTNQSKSCFTQPCPFLTSVAMPHRSRTPSQNRHQAGGIVTICWHWFAPTLATGPKSFYTEQTDFSPTAALDPTHPHHALLLRDIDAVATQLQRLHCAGVPVLWRPLHEAEGGWFWWGRGGAGPFRQLWRLLHERLTGHHGLRNLVWVFTSEGDGSGSHRWYPGDGVVDVVATDVYSKVRDGYVGMCVLGCVCLRGGSGGVDVVANCITIIITIITIIIIIIIIILIILIIILILILIILIIIIILLLLLLLLIIIIIIMKCTSNHTGGLAR